MKDQPSKHQEKKDIVVVVVLGFHLRKMGSCPFYVRWNKLGVHRGFPYGSVSFLFTSKD